MSTVPAAPTLWQLAAEHRALAAQLESLDLDEQTIKDTLEGELVPLEHKALACIAVAGTLAATADAFASRAKQLADHAKSLERRSEWLRTYVRDAMQVAGISEIRGPDFIAKLRQNPERVVIDAESQIPQDYYRIKTTMEIDKPAIRDALRAGTDAALAAAAHLERGVSLVVK